MIGEWMGKMRTGYIFNGVFHSYQFISVSQWDRLFPRWWRKTILVCGVYRSAKVIPTWVNLDKHHVFTSLPDWTLPPEVGQYKRHIETSAQTDLKGQRPGLRNSFWQKCNPVPKHVGEKGPDGKADHLRLIVASHNVTGLIQRKKPPPPL